MGGWRQIKSFVFFNSSNEEFSKFLRKTPLYKGWACLWGKQEISTAISFASHSSGNPGKPGGWKRESW